MATLESLTDALGKTNITPSGVSFAGKGLKLNNEEDAQAIIKAINECKDMHFLNLEGNTLGIEAAKAISKALEGHVEFKRALWKDLFTGRMKNEIPIALHHLGDGLIAANVRLTELDLSDNAFGPIGVEGLATLLRGSCCYGLEELRLNNNGLGINGGKMLANALMDCYKSSTQDGRPMPLKVFIAGRNRLENPGATALAEVFRIIGTLEEIAMPQNGIYHPGITALCEAFKNNPNLKIINLNDNTIGAKGAKSLGRALPLLTHLKSINFGDCLLKTKGSVSISESLRLNTTIEEIILDSNEMRFEGAMKLIALLDKKPALSKVSLNGNCFGVEGCRKVHQMLEKLGKAHVLESLSDDEGDEDDDEDSAEDSSDGVVEVPEESSDGGTETVTLPQLFSVAQFLEAPTPDKLIALGEKRSDMLVDHAKGLPSNRYIESFLELLFQVASITNMSKQDPVKTVVVKCCEQLCVELFAWCQKHDKILVLNNALLVSLLLIKSEDKTFKPRWDIDSCFVTLESIVNKNYFPQSTRDILKIFLQRDVARKGAYFETKKRLLEYLR